MKFNQVITKNEWIQIVGDITPDTNIINWKNIMTQLYFIHGEREVRKSFEDSANITDYTTAFINCNLQKILYLLSTANEEFLSSDNTTSSTSTNEDNAFNTDYYGGEGKTQKDTGEQTISSTNKSLNNKDKLRQFYDITNNHLFKTLMNNMCDTFIIDEEIRW